MRILALFLILFVTPLTYANPVVLHCTFQDGSDAGKIEIDLQERHMKMVRNGISEMYDLVNINENYITAFHVSKHVGGTIFSMKRISGFFVQASIYKFIDPDNPTDADAVMANSSYEGRCSRRAL